ncbi:MAG: helix-turn-helix transcriptional regulator [Solirubrobacterales bacterium]
MRNDELGHSIRAWRDRLDPVAAGLSASARRRAPGLRREELAGLAGVSVDYLARLEQGRAANPSPQVLAALARALRLSDEERAHLYLVAGQAPPGSGRIDRHITPGVQRMLDRLDDMPLVVYDATWDLVAWNELGAALLGDLEALTGRERNLAWREFLGSGRSRFRRDAAEAERFRREIVYDLHAAVGAYPEDERLAALVADLRAGSEDFERYWTAGRVAVRTGSRKVIEHPEVGPILVDCDVLSVRASDMWLIVYSAAPGTEDAEKLALLGVVGLQRMAG